MKICKQYPSSQQAEEGGPGVGNEGKCIGAQLTTGTDKGLSVWFSKGNNTDWTGNGKPAEKWHNAKVVSDDTAALSSGDI